jgi:nicotinic acid mononucleotide adenylyltransferase
MDQKSKINYNQLNYFQQIPSSQLSSNNNSEFSSPLAVNNTNNSNVNGKNNSKVTQLHNHQQQQPQLPPPTNSDLSLSFESPIPSSVTRQHSHQHSSGGGLHTAGGISTSSSTATHKTIAKLPAYTEIYSSSPNAAGLPILEIIKRLEDEGLINRQDRLLLKDCIYSTNINKREDVIKALCDIELNNSSRFSVRRLKSLLYENGAGEISSKQTNSLLQQQQPQPAANLFPTKPGESSPTKSVSSHKESLQARVGHLTLISNDTNYQNLSSSALLQHNNQSQSTNHGGILTGNNNNNTNNNDKNELNRSKKIYVSQHSNGVSSYDELMSPMNSSRSAAGKFASFTKKLADNVVQQQQQQQQHLGSPRKQPPQDTSPSHHSPLSAHNPSTTHSNNKKNNNNNNNPASKPYHSARSSSDRPIPSQKPSPSDHLKKAASQKPPKQQQQQQDSDDDEEESRDMWNVQDNVSKVMGQAPQYSGQQNNSSILHKILKRFEELKNKVNLTKLLTMGHRKIGVLVGSGSFNPLTRMHLRTYFLAKQYLENKFGYFILGSLLSPAHSVTVRERYRNNPLEIIPSPHRLAVAQLLVQNSQWLSIDPWEISRRRAMDYLSLLEHVATILKETIPPEVNNNVEIQIIYVCKPNLVTILSPQAMRANNFHCITVCRSPESDYLRTNLSSKWNGIFHIVEDNAILDASLDMVTSRKVRDKIKNSESVEQLVGSKINEYVQFHRFGPKVSNPTPSPS